MNNTEDLLKMTEAGEITMERALRLAYNRALSDLEELLCKRAVKMSTVKDHAYFRAVGTREIERCVESLTHTIS